MQMIKKLIFIVLCVLAVACQKQIAVTDTHGNVITMNNLHGKWLIVNYWANWCGSCTKEFNDLEQFYQTHKEKVIVLGVNFDGMTADKINAIQKKHNLHFPMASHFPIEHYGVKHIDNLPRTFVFSPDGKLQTTLYGPQTAVMLAKEIHHG